MKAELKLKTLSPDEIASAVGGKLIKCGAGAARAVTNITYDSRDVSDGSLFCAIKGERVDGHDYIKDVVEKGCAVVLAERKPDGAETFGSYCMVIVDDSVRAIGLLSGYYRTFSSAKIVGQIRHLGSLGAAMRRGNG